jgi:hypothetical protein
VAEVRWSDSVVALARLDDRWVDDRRWGCQEAFVLGRAVWSVGRRRGSGEAADRGGGRGDGVEAGWGGRGRRNNLMGRWWVGSFIGYPSSSEAMEDPICFTVPISFYL